MNYIIRVITLISVLFSFSCTQDNEKKVNDYIYSKPLQINDGWETASLAEENLNELPLCQFMDELQNNLEHNIHSILIIKNNKLVFEEYFSGFAYYNGQYTEYNIDVKHDLASVTKSVTSTLLGIAIDKGFIANAEQKIFAYFPEYKYLNNKSKGN